MKRTPAKKKAVHRKKTYTLSIRYIFIALAILALIGSGKIYSGLSKMHVLGASTGPVLLADHGSDDSAGGSGTDTSGSNGNSGSGSSAGETSGGGSTGGGDSHGGPGPSGDQNSITASQPSISTQVDCVGPDGKHFVTSFRSCQELNQKWGHSNFHFTPLVTSAPGQPTDNRQEASHSGEKINTRAFKSRILNLEAQGVQVQIHRDGDGKISIHTKDKEGKETQLTGNNLADINDALKDVEIGTASADELTVRSGSVSAHTTFPLSIDPSTNTLSITTPAGTKDVTVLPNQAVEGILKAHILSNILSQSSSVASDSAGATTVIGLTSLNDQPVFEVQGIKEKHLLGVFPVAFPKTVTVSAQTGQVLRTQENFINSILENLSF